MNNVKLISPLLIGMCASSGFTSAEDLSIASQPFDLAKSQPPMVMMVMGRDHKLYYEAYNDASDLNNDGALDTSYNPNLIIENGEKKQIGYYGYFSSKLCYEYKKRDSGQSELFVPVGETEEKTSHEIHHQFTCGGANQWSGDFLNYLTTSRMDAVRKVLYGGYRAVDGKNITVLERSYLPQDAHSWGKEYKSINENKYDIELVSPLKKPIEGRHLFASTTLLSGRGKVRNSLLVNYSISMPLLRVAPNSPSRIWNWVSKERPVAGEWVDKEKITKRNEKKDYKLTKSDSVDLSSLVKNHVYDFAVRVVTCTDDYSQKESNCKQYTNDDGSNSFKPVGLLHEKGEKGDMYFGLMTGSYDQNTSGGILRQAMENFSKEIVSGGRFKKNIDKDYKKGIVYTIDNFKVIGFGGAHDYTRNSGNLLCRESDFSNTSLKKNKLEKKALIDGYCSDWGNPIAEIMYESLRYFSGAREPSPNYNTNNIIDDMVGLPRDTIKEGEKTIWPPLYKDQEGGEFERCSVPVQLVLSDINPSYDADGIPGSEFEKNALSGKNDLKGFNGKDYLNRVSNFENTFDDKKSLFKIGQKYYIGEAENNFDGAPSAKVINSLSTATGLAPEDPTRQGSFYSAAVSYYGSLHEITSGEWLQGGSKKAYGKKMHTYAVGLASPLPKIEIPTGNGLVQIVPFAKTVFGTFGSFKPTNQIVDFYVEEISADRKSGKFRINFEDIEQGNDHDMDAIVQYEYKLAGNKLTITLRSQYASGGANQHIGYIISGTENDGIYLEVRDFDTSRRGPSTTHGGEVFSLNNYTYNTPPIKWADGKGGYKEEKVNNAIGYGCTNNKQWRDKLPPEGANRREFNNYKNYDRCHSTDLPLEAKRIFTVKPNATSVGQLETPLKLAARYGNPKKSDENYLLVTNPGELKDKLENALDNITKIEGASSTAAVNSGYVSTNTLIFQGLYDSKDWTGEINAFKFDNDGKIKKEPEWEAAKKINLVGRKILTYDPDAIIGDKGLFFLNEDKIVNRLLSEIPGSEIKSVDKDAWVRKLINYIRGNKVDGFRDRNSKLLGDIVNSNPVYIDKPKGVYPSFWKDKLYPTKENPENSGSTSYVSFSTSHKKRTKMLAFGANDGMLHIIQADDSVNGGKELLAYVPTPVYKNLHYLADKDYINPKTGNHRYYVDGQISVKDVYYDNNWHSVLVSTLGAGGKGIFALDITNPTKIIEDDSYAKKTVLWEFTSQTDSMADDSRRGDVDLGYTIGDANIIRLHDGTWAAVFGNGYNSVNGKAYLFIVNIKTGELIKKLGVEGSSLESRNFIRNFKNGLSSPTPVDYDNDFITDYVFAGDLHGNMWFFDLTDQSKNNWKEGKLFFQTPPGRKETVGDVEKVEPQSITVRPRVVRRPSSMKKNDLLVFFGTGKYLEVSDKGPVKQPTQTFYGLRFNPNKKSKRISTDRSTLLQQHIITDIKSHTFVKTKDDVEIHTDYPVRITSNNKINKWLEDDTPDADKAKAYEGWYIDLVNTKGEASVDKDKNVKLVPGKNTENQGERVISHATILGDRVIFNTLQPGESACSSGTTSMLMELNYEDGSWVNDQPAFDLNNDGYFNEGDNYLKYIQISGVKLSETHRTSNPAILVNKDGSTTKVVNSADGKLLSIKESDPYGGDGRKSWRQFNTN
ncbi:pilus assembly protein [Zooshikella ganghwensis]|uniref:pilus assembly protein n=1 Tax=Zooshikella ganghwensis TaxID=202772 RepID=UPI0004293FE5|nr:PilC/PilY family type IV pilus protein [Zooshikella ganghwensis]